MQGQQEQAKAEQGERIAEDARYGQAISEEGFGGMTTEGSSDGNQGMFDIFLLYPAMIRTICEHC